MRVPPTYLPCFIGVVSVQAWLGYFDARRFLAIQNTAIYSAAAAVNWLILFAVLYGAPLLP